MSIEAVNAIKRSEKLRKAIMAAGEPITDAIHRPQLLVMLERIMEGDGTFSYADIESFHPNIFHAGMILGGYPRGARDSSYKDEFSGDIAAIVDGAKERSVAETFKLIYELERTINEKHPEYHFYYMSPRELLELSGAPATESIRSSVMNENNTSVSPK